MKSRSFTVILYKGENMYIAECPEVGTNTQGTEGRQHISHIYPQSEYPNLIDDINISNIFLEDPHENFVRGSNVATPAEVLNAQLDNSMDIFDNDWNDDGILNDGIFI
ncbi:MAG: hypothetical protein VKN72_25575 [Nostocales cyanobacterium 94392]|nr:hypothetical protein [Nostocales cyanobacterium 94392]